jgi:putative NIF3 family GTP cyclohydrolase 1 type 2
VQERATPVKVFDELIRETVRWVEVHRPLDADREGATQWVLSAAFSMVVVAGAACASVGALGGEIAEEDFLDLAREAFRRAHRNVTGPPATA